MGKYGMRPVMMILHGKKELPLLVMVMSQEQNMEQS